MQVPGRALRLASGGFGWDALAEQLARVLASFSGEFDPAAHFGEALMPSASRLALSRAMTKSRRLS